MSIIYFFSGHMEPSLPEYFLWCANAHEGFILSKI